MSGLNMGHKHNQSLCNFLSSYINGHMDQLFCDVDEYEGESEILVEGFDGSKRFEIGKIYISKDERLRFTASFQKRLQAEPPLTQVQPLEFKTTDDVITTINSHLFSI